HSALHRWKERVVGRQQLPGGHFPMAALQRLGQRVAVDRLVQRCAYLDVHIGRFHLEARTPLRGQVPGGGWFDVRLAGASPVPPLLELKYRITSEGIFGKDVDSSGQDVRQERL